MANEAIFSCTLEIPYHCVKKNGRPVFNGRLVPNHRTTKAKKFMLPLLQRARLASRLYEPIDCDLLSVLTFVYSQGDYYTRDPKTKLLRRKHTVADTSNLVEFVHDSLQEVGIIEDDQQICDLHVRRLVGETTSLKIELYRIEEVPLQLSL